MATFQNKPFASTQLHLQKLAKKLSFPNLITLIKQNKQSQ